MMKEMCTECERRRAVNRCYPYCSDQCKKQALMKRALSGKGRRRKPK